MAGGGNRKKFNKSKSRKPTKQSSSSSLFVEGGLLSDWSPLITSPPSRGNSNNANSTGNKSKNKSAVKFEIGSTSGAKPKSSASKTRPIEYHKQKKNNAFSYQYPQVIMIFNEFLSFQLILGKLAVFEF
ncbi:uncharacterized protein [Rutidosis leptorrhynchoides]|uniref:uncharacterized protein n=1 Tax=Rutidosis leptorrhynchoides TaxID=125765 RepID=UPI003A993210